MVCRHQSTITSNRLNDYMSDLTADIEVRIVRHHVAYLHRDRTFSRDSFRSAASRRSLGQLTTASGGFRNRNSTNDNKLLQTTAK